jgi:hypothetical protein
MDVVAVRHRLEHRTIAALPAEDRDQARTPYRFSATLRSARTRSSRRASGVNLAEVLRLKHLRSDLNTRHGLAGFTH